MWQAQEGLGQLKHSPERKDRRDHKVLKVQSDSPEPPGFRVQ